MTLAQNIPGHTPQEWATAFLTALNLPTTQTNIDSITRWMSAESGGYNPNSPGGRNNPLNTVVQPGVANAGQGGSQGDIADYGTFQQGVNASANLFSHNRNAQPILAALRRSDQPGTFAAINTFYQSWGGSFSPGGTPSEVAAAGGSTSSDAEAAAPDTGCPKLFGFKAVGFTIGLNRCQGRALLGGVALVGGVILMTVALVAITGKGAQVIQVVPGAARMVP